MPVTQITYRLSQQMLTEDGIVEVAMSVQYNIADLKNYVLNDVILSELKEATQSACAMWWGSEMYKVLTEGREVLGRK